MPDRQQDWFNQAVRDLEQAEDSRRADRHEWACFAAQQAAEKEEAIRYAREIVEFVRSKMA
jgi:HEPN domain-containing protein